MELYRWDEEKNRKLIRERNVSFEEIVFCIEQGQLLDLLQPEQERYKHQKQFVVEVRGYIYLVPFVSTGDEIFLKTIIPSRKLTRRYLDLGGTNDA